MGRIGRYARIVRQQGFREVLRILLTRCLDRLNADNNDDPATNGEFALLRAYLKPGMMVLDVGANRGEWTAQVLGIQPSLRIYAFEPVLHIFAALQQRFTGDGRLVLINAALADQAGQSEIYIDGDWSGSNSLFCRDIFRNSRTETIRMITGDTFVAERKLGSIDFLKIDVEGAELKVLQGFRETFARRQIGLCQLEYGGTYLDARVLLRDIFAFAVEMGYGVAKLMPRSLRLLGGYDPILENFNYANYLLYRDADRLPRRFVLKGGKGTMSVFSKETAK